MAVEIPAVVRKTVAKNKSPGFIDGLRGLFLPLITYFQSYIESGKIDIDLLYMISYMDAIATADINRDEIFRMASEREEFVTSKYIKQVYMLAKNWNYEYSVACLIVSKRVANKRLKDLLARLANAMASGEPEKKFLDSEWQTMLVIYKNEYERSLESLKKWTDAYTALLVSMTFISVTITLSVTLYNFGDPATTLTMTMILIGIVAFIGVYILRSEAPKEIKTHRLKYISTEQQRIKDLSKVLVPLAVILAAIMAILRMDMGYILIAVGLIILPMGLIGKTDDKNIDMRDKDFSQFTKMLGSVVGGMGVTIKEGITKVDQKSIGTLEPIINKLYVRLIMGMEPRLCWIKFVGSTGSDLINKFTYIFLDALDKGGDAAKVGKLVNTTNLEVVLLRMKRKLVSSSFSSLIVPMHVSMAGLTLFVIEILITFSGMIAKLYSTMDFSASNDMGSSGFSPGTMGFNLFQNVPVDLLSEYAIILVLILTVANSMAAVYVDGGDKYKLYYYGAIMSVTSGLCLLIVPMLVHSIFNFQGIT